LWMAYVEELDHGEIAAASGVGEKSVRVLLSRARDAFAGILNRLGLRPEAADVK
jgi:DNA-directed RNA polymerase specialized sigma24 family protein